MNNSSIHSSTVSISDFQEVVWLSWKVCPYTDSVAVFRFMVTESIITALQASNLQPDELQRANRYHRRDDRNRFICGRHLLRVLLARYTHRLPEEIVFSINKNRKPEITDNIDWCFNVSHSGNCVLIVIGRKPVGVDIEFVDWGFTFQLIIPTSFTTIEQHYIQANLDSAIAFYQLWTRKEALVKATGKGLDDDFSIIPSLTGLHSIDSHRLGATGNWMVHSFDVTKDYPAAVAYPTGLELPKFYTVDSGFFPHFTS